MTLGFSEFSYPSLPLAIAHQGPFDLTKIPFSVLMLVISILLVLLGAFGRIDTKWFKAELPSWARALFIGIGVPLLIFSIVRENRTENNVEATVAAAVSATLASQPTNTPTSTSMPSATAAITTDTPTPRTTPYSISIYEECYHLGNDIDSDFCRAEPQANPFEVKFQIDQISGSAYIQLTVKNVGPNERERKPIYVNGSFVDLLNRYVTAESENKEVKISILEGILHKGENNILIFSAPYVIDSETRVDDFEFRDLKIVFE